ncbi:TPA: hypothetical protein ACH3X1_014689 [Trebouxia sp. C0004]
MATLEPETMSSLAATLVYAVVMVTTMVTAVVMAVQSKDWFWHSGIGGSIGNVSKATKGAEYDATGGAVDDRTGLQKVKDKLTPGSSVGQAHQCLIVAACDREHCKAT